ncbi:MULTISPECIES: SRPBCC family protein [Acidobacteriaceae]|uniref:SRPBCC family protein n=1 Tax=Acidobacteriaceae TaxID=204434 RepID=UPI00131B0086|nr:MULTISPECIES: SRPBCC family protein [Acidobacteriaceae]MDW5266845.1 SRPBCC family protein [Edaphobacter sp.]
MSHALKEKPYAEELPVTGAAGMIIEGRYVPPPEDKDGKLWVRTSALIQADPKSLYTKWRNVEDAPSWQEQITQVVITGDRTSHWVMKADDKTIEWDSEVLADEPGKRIAWRSIGGDSDNAGEVIFEDAPGGRGTIVTVLQEFRMGKLASVWETFVGRNPKQAVIENLRHFKALAETGEIPRNQGQPHEDRGLIGKMKASTYGETVPTPPGSNRIAS